MLSFDFHGVPIECINQAAIRYYVPATLILAVIKAEGGRNGMARKNTNGTYDYGVMQVNSRWLNKIKPYGYTARDLQYSPCKNVEVGTWILSQSIAEAAALKKGIGYYHSHTEHLNQKYHQKVSKLHQEIYSIVNNHKPPRN